ncbi:MAG TPA: hypothetical protein VFF65_07685 [Phycisphaerales bacterium]|nr:hypothetical protein [Phycisphaerales bacterium]
MSTTRSIASVLACVTLVGALCGCANNDRRASDDGYYTSSAANNRACPVCGMDADPQFSAWDNGREVDCCSQACEDKFNNASASEKRVMMSRAYDTVPATATSGVVPGDASASYRVPATNTVMYNGQEYPQENKVCPITGRQVDGTHYVIADGHRVDFASQAAADQFAAMSYEKRTETRLAAR